jgi:carbonic anhydrase/acetyltransferase-like protein (isoleucine patch superfamily)
MYITVVFTSIFFAKILLILVNWRHKPREGTFLRDASDKDYRYWCIRNVIKRFPIWVAHKFPFPFLDNFCLKAFGVKTSIHNSLFEGWVDTEFIEIGDNVVVGQGSIVQSAVIMGNLLIIRKTVIGDNVRIGSHAFIMPGTQIGNNCVLATNSATTVGQKLEEGWVFVGVPAKKFKKNVFFEDGLEKVLGEVKDVEALREKYEMIYLKRSDEKLTRKERKKITEEKREIEKRRLEEGI